MGVPVCIEGGTLNHLLTAYSNKQDGTLKYIVENLRQITEI